jgi:hypothetical protein
VGSKIDIAWTLIGLFGTLSFLAMVLTLSEQWVRSRRLGNTSHTYETVLGATEALIAAEGGPDAERVNGVHGETLRKLLTSSRTSSDAIEALAAGDRQGTARPPRRRPVDNRVGRRTARVAGQLPSRSCRRGDRQPAHALVSRRTRGRHQRQ